jgi:hypothetical protein
MSTNNETTETVEGAGHRTPVPVSRCVIQDSRTNKTNSKHNLTYQINRGFFLNRLRYFFTGLIQQFALYW